MRDGPRPGVRGPGFHSFCHGALPSLLTPLNLTGSQSKESGEALVSEALSGGAVVRTPSSACADIRSTSDGSLRETSSDAS